MCHGRLGSGPLGRRQPGEFAASGPHAEEVVTLGNVRAQGHRAVGVPERDRIDQRAKRRRQGRGIALLECRVEPRRRDFTSDAEDALVFRSPNVHHVVEPLPRHRPRLRWR